MIIGDKRIDESNRCFIIAEVGVNHNGDIRMAKELIKLASQSGADAVKFQSFISEELYSTVRGQAGIDFLKKYELTKEQHRELFEYAKANKIIFISTPFDFLSAKMLNDLGVKAFKIASGEINYHDFIHYVSSFKKPLILSSGGCSLSEVEKTREVIFSTGNTDLAILHCISAYPAPPESLNLKVITTLKTAFPDCIIGYSDHSEGIEASIVAVTLGAKVIEKHFTMDKNLPGPDHKASSDPEELLALVRGIRKAEAMLGLSIKQYQSCEGKNRRSLVASRDINKGEIIENNDIVAKRPVGGLPPEMKSIFISRQARIDIPKDEFISIDQI